MSESVHDQGLLGLLLDRLGLVDLLVVARNATPEVDPRDNRADQTGEGGLLEGAVPAVDEPRHDRVGEEADQEADEHRDEEVGDEPQLLALRCHLLDLLDRRLLGRRIDDGLVVDAQCLLDLGHVGLERLELPTVLVEPGAVTAASLLEPVDIVLELLDVILGHLHALLDSQLRPVDRLLGGLDLLADLTDLLRGDRLVGVDLVRHLVGGVLSVRHLVGGGRELLADHRVSLEVVIVLDGLDVGLLGFRQVVDLLDELGGERLDASVDEGLVSLCRVDRDARLLGELLHISRDSVVTGHDIPLSGGNNSLISVMRENDRYWLQRSSDHYTRYRISCNDLLLR